MNDIQLLPCPFCGGKATVKRLKQTPPELPIEPFMIECCNASNKAYSKGHGCPTMPMAFGDTLTEAAELWNTRVGE